MCIQRKWNQIEFLSWTQYFALAPFAFWSANSDRWSGKNNLQIPQSQCFSARATWRWVDINFQNSGSWCPPLLKSAGWGVLRVEAHPSWSLLDGEFWELKTTQLQTAKVEKHYSSYPSLRKCDLFLLFSRLLSILCSDLLFLICNSRNQKQKGT